jgi:2-succinyl-5-enolpyruvyl-6-hydroxy-3-cyclohexene-1-carboxylate synthase
MLSSDKVLVQLIVDQCEAYGIKKIVFSPGSRNAPFAISFDENPFFDTYVIHDERVAAFFALGLSQELNEPVAICCTSGSAALNYYPAIAEAFYRCVPILVITADRPASWVNQGDGQTIVQNELFKSHIRYSISFDDTTISDDAIWRAQLNTTEGMSFLYGKWKGPVHFNVGLSEPLYNTVEKSRNFSRLIQNKLTDNQINSNFLEKTSQQLSESKIMVLCGQLAKNDELNLELEKFAKNSNVIVLVENTSNLFNEAYIACIDRTLNGIPLNGEEKYQPDILITLGGAVVSKKIKSFLRKAKPKMHWKIGYEFPWMDTYQCLSDSIELEPEKFFKQINEIDYQRNKQNYFGLWKTIDYLAKDSISACMENIDNLTDLVVFDSIFQTLPENYVLHMANSSVVRYCQLFDPIHNVRYESNRGTSGIDGSTSTAVGAAMANPNQLHVLISGDISFLYDSNALWISDFPKNLKIIVVNNQGGGIFKIIPGPAGSNQGRKYFESAHTQQAEPIAKAFGLTCKSIVEKSDLFETLVDFFDPNNITQLIEIHTDSDQNPKDLDYFFNFINKA